MPRDPREAFNAPGEPPRREIATAAEVEALKNQRAAPEPALSLEPPDIARFRDDYDRQRRNERRIAYLEARLSVASGDVRRQVGRAMGRER